MYVMLLILLVAVTVAAVGRWGVVACARQRRQLHARMRGVRCGAPDGIGLSVLLVESAAPRQIEALLTVEYTAYEVVVVIDSVQEAAAFVELVRRYHLIRVEYRPTGDFPSVAVGGLYRSRRRPFRRLVVVDTAAERRSERMNAAADVAAYDYLLPIRRGERLADGAVERLVSLIGERTTELRLLRITEGIRCFLCLRSAAAAAGGFARFPARRRGRLLHERILCRMEGERNGRWRATLALSVAGGVVLLFAVEPIGVRAAVAVTIAVGVLAALRIRQLTGSD